VPPKRKLLRGDNNRKGAAWDVQGSSPIGTKTPLSPTEKGSRANPACTSVQGKEEVRGRGNQKRWGSKRKTKIRVVERGEITYDVRS